MPTYPTSVRALICPHTDATIWAAESSYTEQGPRTGTPTPDPTTPSALQLVGAGEQTSGSSLDLLIQRGGFGLRGEAGLVWRRDGDTAYYGQDVPSAITDFSTPETHSGTPGVATSHPHILALPSGVVLCVYQYEAASAVTIACRRYVSGAWGSRITVRTRNTVAQDLWPCLLLLPDGRVLCASWYDDSTSLTLWIAVSSDDGATWSTHQRYALAEPLESAITGRRIRMAYANGQIAVVAETIHGGAYEILQWASDDLGATLHLVGTAFNGAKPELWFWAGALRIAYLSNDFNTGTLRRGGPAFEALGNYTAEALFVGSEAITIWGSATAYTDGELAICQTDDGTLWGYGLLPGLDHVGTVYRSQDGGTTWESVGESSTSGSDPATIWWNPWTTDTIYPRDYAAAWFRGQVLIATEHTGAVRAQAIDCLHMGGMSTVTLPPLQAVQRNTAQVAWERAYVPLCDPVDLGYTAAGAGTSAVTGDVLVFTTTIGQARSYSTGTFTGDTPEGIIAYADVECTLGGSVTALPCGFLLRTADATKGYEVEIRLSTTQLRVYDNIAAATLATVTLDGTTYPAMAAGIRILCALAAGEVAVWVCARRTDERAWILVHQGAVTDDAAAGGTTNVATWGHVDIAVADTTSEWVQFHLVNDTFTGAQLAGGQTNPDELFPVGLSARPVYLADGASVSAVAGPAAVGDAWTLDATADYPLSVADLATEASVRRAWRSINDSADQVIAWQLDTLEESYGDATEALWLAGCNWRTATLEYHDGAAWQSLASLDLATGLTALPYLRKGGTITVDTASSPPGSRWLERGELVGATVDLGGGKLRRVIRQTEGTWSATGRLPILTLDGCDGTEGASGTCNIWPTSALILIHHTSTTRERKGYRLTIGAQDTIDNDFSLKYLLGYAVPFAIHPDDASDREVLAPVEEVEEGDGTLYRRALGPARRRVTWTWSDGVLEHWIGGATPTPPTWTATSTANAPTSSASGAEAQNLQALVEELDALAVPVVCALYVPAGTPNVVTLTARRLFLPAAIEGPITAEEAQGVSRDGDSEYSGRLVRISTVALRELV